MKSFCAFGAHNCVDACVVYIFAEFLNPAKIRTGGAE